MPSSEGKDSSYLRTLHNILKLKYAAIKAVLLHGEFEEDLKQAPRDINLMNDERLIGINYLLVSLAPTLST